MSSTTAIAPAGQPRASILAGGGLGSWAMREIETTQAAGADDVPASLDKRDLDELIDPDGEPGEQIDRAPSTETEAALRRMRCPIWTSSTARPCG